MTGKPADFNRPKHLSLVDAALNLRQAGDNDLALTVLKKALDVEPGYLPAHVLMGVIYQALRQPKDAEAAFRNVLGLEPDNAEALQSLGLLLVSSSRASEGIAYLEKYVRAYPEDTSTLNALLGALNDMGREADGLALVQHAWETTHNPELGVRYARLLISRGGIDAAYAVLEDVLHHERSARHLTEMALTLVIQEKHSEALEALQEAVERDPQFDRAWRGLAHCYTQLDQPEQALEAAERALAVNPIHYRNWQAKGDALLALERYADALEAAGSGLELIDEDDTDGIPVVPVLYSQRLTALLGLGRMEEALAEARRARAAAPRESRFYELAVQLLLAENQPTETLEWFRAADDAGLPSDGPLAPWRYQALHQAGQATEAWRFIQPQLKTKSKTRARILADRGIALYRQGYPAAARAVFEQLLRVAPAEARLLMDLGFLLIGEGELALAEEKLTAALKTEKSEALHPLINSNLGYLSLLRQRWNEAKARLQKALEDAPPDDTAILRVAFWQNGQLVADYAPHPTRQMRLVTAARANLAALALARDDADRALALAQDIITNDPEARLGYAVQGCVQAARGQAAEAAQAWKEALKRPGPAAETKLIKEWLGQVKLKKKKR